MALLLLLLPLLLLLSLLLTDAEGADGRWLDAALSSMGATLADAIPMRPDDNGNDDDVDDDDGADVHGTAVEWTLIAPGVVGENVEPPGSPLIPISMPWTIGVGERKFVSDPVRGAGDDATDDDAATDADVDVGCGIDTDARDCADREAAANDMDDEAKDCVPVPVSCCVNVYGGGCIWAPWSAFLCSSTWADDGTNSSPSPNIPPHWD